MHKNKTLLKVIAAVTYFAMVAVNALANILPINNITTGEVSDAYPNLFAPAGITFSIWGLIYFLLLLYVFYQFLPKSKKKEEMISKINIYFIISSLANIVWILLWHNQLIVLTVVVMLVILLSLIKISRLSNQKGLASERWLIKIPFGVYFGWITIATIANITTLLVSLGWENFLLPDSAWMIIVLLVGVVIASITTIQERNIAYGLVPIWAYFGIYLKHTSPAQFDFAYPAIAATAILGMIIFGFANGYLVGKRQMV